MKAKGIDFSALKTYEYVKDISKSRNKRVFSYVGGENFQFPSSVKKIYEIGEDVYLRDSYGFLYKRINGTFSMVSGTQFGTDLKFIPVIYGGDKVTLVVTPSAAELCFNNLTPTQVSVPYGILRFYAGRIFVASGKTLYYSDLFDFTSFSVGGMRGGFINVEDTDGDISGIEEKDGKLFLVCENSILSVTAFGQPSEFKMEKVCGNYGVLSGTVAKAGNNVYFVSGNQVKKFDGKNIETVSSALLSETVLGEAEGYAGKYVVTIQRNTTRLTYVYEDDTGEEDIVSLPPYAQCSGAVVVRLSVNKVFRLTGSYAEVFPDTETVTDFGTSKKKAAIAADVSITGSAVLNIKGETETVSKQITNGENYMQFNVTGRSFRVYFTDTSSNFSLNRLKIIYAVFGG